MKIASSASFSQYSRGDLEYCEKLAEDAIFIPTHAYKLLGS